MTTPVISLDDGGLDEDLIPPGQTIYVTTNRHDPQVAVCHGTTGTPASATATVTASTATARGSRPATTQVPQQVPTAASPAMPPFTGFAPFTGPGPSHFPTTMPLLPGAFGSAAPGYPFSAMLGCQFPGMMVCKLSFLVYL